MNKDRLMELAGVQLKEATQSVAEQVAAEVVDSAKQVLKDEGKEYDKGNIEAMAIQIATDMLKDEIIPVIKMLVRDEKVKV